MTAITARPRTSTTLAITALTLSIGLSSCRCGDDNKTGGDSPAVPAALALIAQKDAPNGLNIRLSEGDLAGKAGTREKLAAAEPLSADDTAKLLARLPAFAGEAGDQKSFALRKSSQPLPRTGDTIEGTFPPPGGDARPAAPADVDDKAVEVVRFAPEGDVPLAPQLSVTFSRPMVAVTSQDDAAKTVPVKLTPQPEGKWRWVGTRTILFDPKVRFPQATDYKVEIAAGTKALAGAPLAAAKSWTFSTPPPKVVSAWPTNGPHKTRPAVFVLFDQEIDVASVADRVHLLAGADKVTLRQASAAELAAPATEEAAKNAIVGSRVRSLIKNAEDNDHQGRYLVLVPTRELPTDTSIQIVVPKGTPSAEGPVETKSDQITNFRTYGKFIVTDSRCNWRRECPPRSGWTIEMSNPIDMDAFSPDEFTIEPKLTARAISANGRYLYIRGLPKERTSYTVTVPASLTDVFGQTLGSPDKRVFDVGDARPRLTGPGALVVVDPYAKTPHIVVHSASIKSFDVELYKVDPTDWDAFGKMFRRYRQKDAPSPPGRRVFNGKIATAASEQALAETKIEIGKALGGEFGHVIVVVEPSEWDANSYYKPRVVSWVQATKLGVDAFVDHNKLIGWASDLDTGKPASGVSLELVPSGIKQSTGDDGTATFELPPEVPTSRNMLLARRGKDLAMLPENQSWWNESGSWYRRNLAPTLSWFVFDDRSMYRPKEEVHIKGWLRKRGNEVGGDIGAIGGDVSTVSYQVFDSRQNKIATGTANVNAMGGFDMSFVLPDTPNLGNAYVKMSASGAMVGAYQHSFQIEEFRRPEYEVTTEVSQGPFTIGESATVTASAQYYAGGGLPAAPVRWNVQSNATTFNPPGQDGFTFGEWIPWWRSRSFGRGGRGSAGGTNQTLEGVTTSGGKHVLAMDFLSAKPPVPMSVAATAAVTDVNRQTWTATANLLVHPSKLYVGIKRDRYFVDRGKPIEFDLVVADQEGERQVGVPIAATVVRLDWKWKNGRYEEIEKDETKCDKKSSAEPVRCKVAAKAGGTYKISATVIDKDGRPNRSSVRTWVSGGTSPPARNVEKEKISLIPEKEKFAPGETARLLVVAPFENGEGLLSIRRSGIVRTQRITFKGSSTVIEVPIADGDTPNLHVHIDAVGKSKRLDDAGQPTDKLPPRPAYAAGAITLDIPPDHRKLSVAVTPGKKRTSPGSSTDVSVVVRDHDGKPVSGAEVAIIVVDESVLALSGKKSPDPLAAFYGARPTGVRDHHSRALVKLAKPEVAAFGATATGADSKDADKSEREGSLGRGRGDIALDESKADMPAPAPAVAQEAAAAPRKKQKRMSGLASASARLKGNKGNRAQPTTPIAVRTNFNALATFAAATPTGADGKVTVPVKLPDNLTRYRVMVAAVDRDNLFGSGESSITARLPLMLRPSPPRFLNFGDKFELPIVLQNQTDESMTVHLAVRTANVKLTAGDGRKVTVAKNDRVEVRFPASAVMAGTARFQVGASAGDFADAKTFDLPVWTPATTEAFATYGSIGPDNKTGVTTQKIAKPTGVVDQFGGLELTTSSTQLAALTDAMLYLYRYPYECAEQLSSRVLAIAGLRDVLAAFEADGLPNTAKIEASVKKDIRELSSMQKPDGGFGFWTYRDHSWPYISVHVAHALARAKQKGYAVPARMITRSQSYMRSIEKHIPHWYGQRARNAIIAYSLYVRKLLGEDDVQRARKVIAVGLDDLSMETSGWLLFALAGNNSAKGDISKLLRHLDNRATETAGGASFAAAMSDGAHLILHSNRRADAIILEALLAEKPRHTLVEKLVRSLLAHRKKGRWTNTQENVFVLLAMDRYFAEYEKVTPNFVARAWLGDGYAGDHKYAGRTTERHRIDIPMAMLGAAGAEQDLVLQRDGRGRLYYRIGMKYAPESLRLQPADYGFVVERKYEAIDDPGDVTRGKDGEWVIKAGARVRVRLTMVAESRRHHVALVDPLPAGLEAQNPALKVTGPLPADPNAVTKTSGRFWWWSRTWYEHQNMRDERVEAFASTLWPGVHNYSYVTTATTPGHFVVPPAKAEEMYAPETFGRSGTDRVIVK